MMDPRLRGDHTRAEPGQPSWEEGSPRILSPPPRVFDKNFCLKPLAICGIFLDNRDDM